MHLHTPNIPPEVLTLLPKALAPWLELNPNALIIPQALIAGKTLADVARATKQFPQCVNNAWKRMLAQNPVWYSIRTGMVGKGVGRKPNTTPKGAPRAKYTKHKPNTSKKVIASAVSSLSKDQRAAVLAYISQLAKGSTTNGSTTGGTAES